MKDLYKLPELPTVFTEEDKDRMEFLEKLQKQQLEYYSQHFGEAWAGKPSYQRTARVFASLLPRPEVEGWRRMGFTEAQHDIFMREVHEELSGLQHRRRVVTEVPAMLDTALFMHALGEPVYEPAFFYEMFDSLSKNAPLHKRLDLTDAERDWIEEWLEGLRGVPADKALDYLNRPMLPDREEEFLRKLSEALKLPSVEHLTASQVMSSVAFSQSSDDIRNALMMAYPPPVDDPNQAFMDTQQHSIEDQLRAFGIEVTGDPLRDIKNLSEHKSQLEELMGYPTQFLGADGILRDVNITKDNLIRDPNTGELIGWYDQGADRVHPAIPLEYAPDYFLAYYDVNRQIVAERLAEHLPVVTDDQLSSAMPSLHSVFPDKSEGEIRQFIKESPMEFLYELQDYSRSYVEEHNWIPEEVGKITSSLGLYGMKLWTGMEDDRISYNTTREWETFWGISSPTWSDDVLGTSFTINAYRDLGLPQGLTAQFFNQRELRVEQEVTFYLVPDIQIVDDDHFILKSDEMMIYHDGRKVGRVDPETGDFDFDDPAYIWKAFVPRWIDRHALINQGFYPPEAFSTAIGRFTGKATGWWGTPQEFRVGAQMVFPPLALLPESAQRKYSVGTGVHLAPYQWAELGVIAACLTFTGHQGVKALQQWYHMSQKAGALYKHMPGATVKGLPKPHPSVASTVPEIKMYKDYQLSKGYHWWLKATGEAGISPQDKLFINNDKLLFEAYQRAAYAGDYSTANAIIRSVSAGFYGGSRRVFDLPHYTYSGQGLASPDSGHIVGQGGLPGMPHPRPAPPSGTQPSSPYGVATMLPETAQGIDARTMRSLIDITSFIQATGLPANQITPQLFQLFVPPDMTMTVTMPIVAQLIGMGHMPADVAAMSPEQMYTELFQQTVGLPNWEAANWAEVLKELSPVLAAHAKGGKVVSYTPGVGAWVMVGEDPVVLQFLPDENTEAWWNSLSFEERKRVLLERGIGDGYAMSTWDRLPESVRNALTTFGEEEMTRAKELGFAPPEFQLAYNQQEHIARKLLMTIEEGLAAIEPDHAELMSDYKEKASLVERLKQDGAAADIIAAARKERDELWVEVREEKAIIEEQQEMAVWLKKALDEAILSEGEPMPLHMQRQFLEEAHSLLPSASDTDISPKLKQALIADGYMLIRTGARDQILAAATVLMRDQREVLSKIVKDKGLPEADTSIAISDILKHVEKHDVAWPPMSEMSPEGRAMYENFVRRTMERPTLAEPTIQTFADLKRVIEERKDWSIISAAREETPEGEKLTPATNRIRMEGLQAALRAEGYEFYDVMGVYKGVGEEAVLVLDIDPFTARRFGSLYNQESILHPSLGFVYEDYSTDPVDISKLTWKVSPEQDHTSIAIGDKTYRFAIPEEAIQWGAKRPIPKDDFLRSWEGFIALLRQKYADLYISIERKRNIFDSSFYAEGEFGYVILGTGDIGRFAKNLVEEDIVKRLVVLHEIGHHTSDYRIKGDPLTKEVDAWKFAVENATRYGIPYKDAVAFVRKMAKVAHPELGKGAILRQLENEGILPAVVPEVTPTAPAVEPTATPQEGDLAVAEIPIQAREGEVEYKLQGVTPIDDVSTQELSLKPISLMNTKERTKMGLGDLVARLEKIDETKLSAENAGLTSQLRDMVSKDFKGGTLDRSAHVERILRMVSEAHPGEEGFEVPEAILEAIKVIPYDAVSWQDFTRMVYELEHPGKLTTERFATIDPEGKVEDRVQALMNQLGFVPPPPDTPHYQAEGKFDAARAKFGGLLVRTYRMERILEHLDRYAEKQGLPAGIFMKTFWEPITGASNQKLRLMHDEYTSFRELVKREGINMKKIWGEKKPMLKEYPDWKMTPSDRIAVYMLNQNRQGQIHLIYGNKLSEENIQNLISQMTPDEHKVAQWMQESFARIYPLVNSTYEQMHGRSMGHIENFFPLMLTPRGLSEVSMERQVALDTWLRDFAKKAESGIHKGFTKERLAAGFQEVKLDAMTTYLNYLQSAAHYAAYAGVIRDLSIVARNPKFREGFIETQGQAKYDVLRTWLVDVAKTNPLKVDRVADGVLRWVRVNTVTAVLGLNITTALKQFASFFGGMAEIGEPAAMQGLFSYLAHPKNTRALQEQYSPEIFHRVMEREVGEMKLAQSARKKLLGKITPREVYMFMTLGMDKLAVNSLWQGAFDKHQKDYPDATIEQAADYATRVIRKTQPFFAIKDVPEFWRSGEAMKALTMFTNQLNQYWNYYIYDIFGKIKYGKGGELPPDGIAPGAPPGESPNQPPFDKPDSLVDMLRKIFWIFVVPGVIIGAITRSRASQNKEELAQDLASQFLAPVPILGNWLAPVIRDSYQDSGTIHTKMFYTMYSLLNQMATEDPDWAKTALTGTELGAYMLGVPFVQPRRTLTGLYDLLEGETDDWLRLIWSEHAREQQAGIPESAKIIAGKLSKKEIELGESIEGRWYTLGRYGADVLSEYRDYGLPYERLIMGGSLTELQKFRLACELQWKEYVRLQTSKERLAYRAENPVVDATLFFWENVSTLRSREAIPVVMTLFREYEVFGNHRWHWIDLPEVPDYVQALYDYRLEGGFMP